MSKTFFIFLIAFFILITTVGVFAQAIDELELTLDLNSQSTPLSPLFKPNIDLSGRGFHQDEAWPQSLAAKETFDTWRKDIGSSGIYRIQYNLWEINQLSKNKDAKSKLIANYEEAIKAISDSGGTVILDLFGTPAGLGKVLDKKSAPVNLRAFKAVIKGVIKNLSCEKKYNVWYEVWNAPDLDDFFIGREQEYFNLYRTVAESVKELESEYKINIPIGGPSVSWWFRSIENNTILTPEKSLIYDLIKFCYTSRLPLDFISWHAFSSNPRAEEENTIYNKNAIDLIRDWLSYFNFNRETPLVIDEWNYDCDANVLPARKEKSFIAASYIPARLKHMFEAGLNNQLYFSLEDFEGNKEGVTRNTGIFYFDPQPQSKGIPKALYNIFRMLKQLGPQMLPEKLNDDFVGTIATRSEDEIAVIIYNYIDPEITKNFLVQDIASLNAVDRQSLLNIIRLGQLNKIILHQQEIPTLHVSNRVKDLLTKAQDLDSKAKQSEASSRNLKITLKNLKGVYSYSRFIVDSSCSVNCEFKPVEQKDITATADSYQEILSLSPYSVNLIILKKKLAPEVVKEADAVTVSK